MSDFQSVEEQVRLALRETAEQVQGPERDWAPSRSLRAHGRRPRLRPIAALAAAFAVLAIVATFVLVLATRDDSPVSIRGSSDPNEVAPDQLPRSDVDLEVFMRVGAPPTEVEAVRGFLASSPSVLRYAYIDQEAALDALIESTSGSCDPSVAERITPDQLPVSFRVALADAAQDPTQIVPQFEGLAGVDDVTIPDRAIETSRPKETCASHTGSPTNVTVAEGVDNGSRWELLARVRDGALCLAFSVDGEVVGGGGCEYEASSDAIRDQGGSQFGAVGPFVVGIARKDVARLQFEFSSGQRLEVTPVGQEAGFDDNFFVAVLPDEINIAAEGFEAIAFDANGRELGREFG